MCKRSVRIYASALTRKVEDEIFFFSFFCVLFTESLILKQLMPILIQHNRINTRTCKFCFAFTWADLHVRSVKFVCQNLHLATARNKYFPTFAFVQILHKNVINRDFQRLCTKGWARLQPFGRALPRTHYI